MDSLTVVVISFLFFFEMLILIFQLIRSHTDTSAPEKTTHYSAIRPAAFTFLFATYIASSFLPMYSRELYRNSQPLWGLSEKVIMGLPISSEMFFVGLAIIVAGLIIDKKGWYMACFIGIAISAVGSVLSGFPKNITEFILYRGVIGFGYGLTWLSFQGYVVSCTDSSKRSEGIANLVAGIFSGSICGGATGGMLAERLGYRPVFWVGAGIIVLSAILIVIFLRSSFKKPQNLAAGHHKTFSLSMLFRFIFDRNIFFILMCCSIPNAICIVGILYYFTPLYLNSMNISSSNIARSLMLYGLMMIYIAPILSRLIDRSERKISYIFFSSFIGSAGLLIFYLTDGIWATIVAILMLSISNGIGNTTRLVFALNTDIVKEIGHGTALGIYQFIERIGQVLGPLSIGLAVSQTDMQTGVILVGASYLLLTLFFFFGAKESTPKALP
jgi:MFS family permease